MEYIKNYFSEVSKIAELIDKDKISKIIIKLQKIKKNKGRLFFLGVGGGAANASHAVNDFRKICGFEAYTPLDNISELSARVNDEGWESIFVNWLKGSQLCEKDGVFIFSVGGGNKEKNISTNLVEALKYAKKARAKIFGIVGRDGGYTAKVADVCIIIPPVNSETITPHTESFQAVVWHLIVSHPEIKESEMKWESIK
ncbi:MAG: SIS domain-containing protein [Candidatus Aminicenantes bacterium]|nr:SIS domain-containing protein [Candidatus Aminicenantes bacterium]